MKSVGEGTRFVSLALGAGLALDRSTETMPSTVIRRFAYCPDSAQLWVEFTTGRRYVYSDVPEEVATTFRSAFAKGVYFNTRIRDRYPHREVPHEDVKDEATHP